MPNALGDSNRRTLSYDRVETSTAEGFYSVPKGVMEGYRLRDREFGSFSVGLIT